MELIKAYIESNSNITFDEMVFGVPYDFDVFLNDGKRVHYIATYSGTYSDEMFVRCQFDVISCSAGIPPNTPVRLRNTILQNIRRHVG